MHNLPPEATLVEEMPVPPLFEPHGGRIFIFPFTMPEDGPLELYIEQIAPRPDHTLSVWLSKKPMDDVVETQMIRNFKIPKRQIRIWLGTKDHPLPQETGWGYFVDYKLEAGETYYVNVKNLENAQNGFELAILPPDDGTDQPVDGDVVIDTSPPPFGSNQSIFIPPRD